MRGLYELDSQKRFILSNGFRHPKTGKLYPPEHPRFMSATEELLEVEMAMDGRRRENWRNR